MTNTPETLSPLAKLVRGFATPWVAAKFTFQHAGVLAWALLPSALALALYLSLIPWAQGALNTWLAASLTALGLTGGAGWLASLLVLLADAALWILAIATSGIVITLIAVPFNDFLAQATEKHCTPPLSQAPLGGWRWQLKLIRLDFLKSALLGGAGLVLIPVGLFPGALLLTLPLGWALLTLQFTSFAQTRRGVTLPGAITWAAHNAPEVVGFGLSYALIFALPLGAVVALPLAVVGGTLLYARTEKA